jgi:hypothetical protein
MRRGGLLLLVLVALAVPGAAVASAGADKGTDRPPASLTANGKALSLTSEAKALWMTEWAACWHEKMGHLSALFHIPIRSTDTPQVAAKKLSKRAMKDLYETQEEIAIGADGCRNGILWRYYHPR